MKIAIIGGGYVGLHTALRIRQANKNWEIKVLDTDLDKVDRFNNDESPIDDFFMRKFMMENPGYLEKIRYEVPDGRWENFDIIFIALSTNPNNSTGARLDTDLIFNLSKEIKKKTPKTSVIIRSTINIDDYSKVDASSLSYWPEFLSQGVETIKNINQSINVVAIQKDDNKIVELFEEIFKGKTLIKTNVKEAILVKVMHNSLDAYLINISNLFANIAEENEIDFTNISGAVESLLSTRTKVKRPGIGYGGSCYPKDSYSLIEITEKSQNKKLIQAFDDFNKEQSFAFLTKEHVIRRAGKIVVLGTSFKGGTNDTTKTPTLSLRNWLLENKIKYKIWEPMISKQWIIDGEEISENIVKDIEDSDLVIVASDWEQFNKLLANYSNDVIDLKTFIKDNNIMNLHNIGKINKH